MMYRESDLIRIAKRENNKKRNYLIVNRLQGKHMPVSPGKAFELFDELADVVKREYKEERLLLIGFAETATAIGARLAVRLDSFYMQTTREEIPEVRYLYFTEDHSHASEQKLVRDDIEALTDQADRIVFVEDEVTTGNTIFHIIDILEKNYPGKMRFSIASLLNGMDDAAVEICAARNVRLHYLLKTRHEKYPGIAQMYAGDGSYIPPGEGGRTEVIELDGCINARRWTTGYAYKTACEKLWVQIKEKMEVCPAQTILVIGTEEFMYPALSVGAHLEECGCTVKCHSTTRSPIAVSGESGYPLHRRYELESFYQDGRRTFLYDLEKYDRVIILTDAAGNLEKGASSLLNALFLCGCDRIQIFRWGKGKKNPCVSGVNGKDTGRTE